MNNLRWARWGLLLLIICFGGVTMSAPASQNGLDPIDHSMSSQSSGCQVNQKNYSLGLWIGGDCDPDVPMEPCP